MKRAALGVLLALLAAAWFGSLAVRPLYKADEARYGEISREMATSGDWVTPRLNGFRYFEKPPLQYWATAAAFKALGEHDWTARLWTALLAAAGVALAYFAGGRLFGRPAGALGAAVLAGSPLYVFVGQLNSLDMGVSVFLAGAIFAFALRRWLLFWAACALAVLSKGLIGIVLPLGTIGLYMIVRRAWPLLGSMRLVPGGLLFLALTAPWFVAVSLANAEFLDFFFIQEHLQRFTTHMHHRNEPWWFFIPVLAAGMAPWLLLLPGALRDALRRSAPGGFDAPLFLVLWSFVVFLFFSLSGSKLPAYILPMFPVLAVLIGRSLAEARPHRLLAAQALFALVGGLALAAGAGALVRQLSSHVLLFANDYYPWLVAAGIALAAPSAASLYCALRERRFAAVGLLAAGSFAAVLIALDGHRTLAAGYSVESMVRSLPAPIAPQARIYAVNAYDHTMPWSLRRTVTMVAYDDELGKAIAWDPQKFIPDLAQFGRAWNQPGDAYAFFALRDFDRLRAELNVSLQVAARGPRYVIVRKP